MKAFIFNSGSGSRMGDLTKYSPKALVELSNGETILSRQIRLLREAGIKEIIISTGPFEEQIINLSLKFPTISFHFINNSKYKETNSIYSLYLCEKLIDDDIIMLHGDLVFDSVILNEVISNPNSNLCLINKTAKQPEKDFKGRIIDNHLKEISVNIFDDNCFALQPLYKFSKKTMDKWFVEIHQFIHNGTVNVYAENALNNILPFCDVAYIDYAGYYIEEIDNVDDLNRVSNEFRLHDYKNQNILITENYLSEIYKYCEKHLVKRPLLVHGKHLLKDQEFKSFIESKNFITYTEYSPNPTYEEVVNGINTFKKHKCDSIISIGGGSCIDVAKAIKLYSSFDGNYINQSPKYVDMPFLAIPTTAGTGTESTRYSVIYYSGEKQSLVHDSLLPDTAILNDKFLYNMPDYHKKASLLDAFCQAIESYWSINSSETSKYYSEQAIKLILNNYRAYLDNNISVYENILLASNLAGKAINITQTTAPHAMSYKITTVTGIAHGHAVSIMLPDVLEHMTKNIHLTQDLRGQQYVQSMFNSLCEVFEVNSYQNLVEKIRFVINYFDLEKPTVSKDAIELFSRNVNPIRLKNSPIFIDSNAANEIYNIVFKGYIV